jgi:hypothetical protein
LVYVSARNVLWIVSFVLILAVAEYGLAIQSARFQSSVDVGTRPGASPFDSSVDTRDFSAHYAR